MPPTTAQSKKKRSTHSHAGEKQRTPDTDNAVRKLQSLHRIDWNQWNSNKLNGVKQKVSPDERPETAAQQCEPNERCLACTG